MNNDRLLGSLLLGALMVLLTMYQAPTKCNKHTMQAALRVKAIFQHASQVPSTSLQSQKGLCASCTSISMNSFVQYGCKQGYHSSLQAVLTKQSTIRS